MKVLTLKPEWASAIFYSDKRVENRTWQTLYRGRLYIHTSSSSSKFAEEWLAANQIRLQGSCPQGYIVGWVDLVDIIDNSTSKWAFENCKHWIIRNPTLLKNPIKIKGQLGIWNFT